MSIATEITRLQTAKADIKTAIEAKGVTVPSTATLDTYDTYVSQISGGGGTNYLADYAAGTLSGAITSTQLGTSMGANMPMYFLNKQNNITSVDLTGTGCTTIAFECCVNCTGLTNAIIPATVTTIGEHLFYQCSNLATITFKAPVGNPYAICTECNSLTLVDLNSSVRNIKAKSFSSNSTTTTANLLEVVLRRTIDMVTIASGVGGDGSNAPFRYRRNIKVYVPSALKATYEADTTWAAAVTAGYLTFVNLEGSQYE